MSGGVFGGGGGAAGADGHKGGTGGACCCFGATSLVDIEDGSQILMKDLRIGQGIMTLDAKGIRKATSFLGWLHRDENQIARFLLITTSEGYKISVTQDHIICVNLGMTFAREVKIGHLLRTRDGTFSPVTSISETMSTGILSPLTMDSTILVDGILASCFADTRFKFTNPDKVELYHQKAHICFAPVRLFPWLLERKSSQGKEGIREYPILLKKVVGKLAGAFPWKAKEDGTKIVSIV